MSKLRASGQPRKIFSLDKPKHLASQNFRADRTCSQFKGTRPRAYWKIIADNLSRAGWSWRCVAAVDSRGDNQRFVVRADEKFVELELSGGISKRRISYSTKLFTSITSAGTGQPARLGILALSYVESYLARSFQSLGFPSVALGSSCCG